MWNKLYRLSQATTATSTKEVTTAIATELTAITSKSSKITTGKAETETMGTGIDDPRTRINTSTAWIGDVS